MHGEVPRITHRAAAGRARRPARSAARARRPAAAMPAARAVVCAGWPGVLYSGGRRRPGATAGARRHGSVGGAIVTWDRFDDAMADVARDRRRLSREIAGLEAELRALGAEPPPRPTPDTSRAQGHQALYDDAYSAELAEREYVRRLRAALAEAGARGEDGGSRGHAGDDGGDGDG